MATTLVTLSGTVADLIGDVVLDGNENNPNRRVKIVIDSNAPSDYIADTAANVMRLGTATVTPGENGTFSFAGLIATGSADTNLDDSANLQYTVTVDYPRASDRKRVTESFGPFAIPTSANIADLVAEQTVPVGFASAFTAEMEELLAEAEAARDDAVDISNIDIDDDIVEILVKNTGGAGPKTSAALSAAIAGQLDPAFEQIPVDVDTPGSDLRQSIDTLINTAVAADGVNLVGPNDPADQPLVHGAIRTLTWETVLRDSGGWFDPAAPTQIVVPPGWAGSYAFNCYVSWQAAGGTVRTLYLLLNGVVHIADTRHPPAFVALGQPLAGTIDLAVGDTLAMGLSHDYTLDSAYLAADPIFTVSRPGKIFTPGTVVTDPGDAADYFDAVFAANAYSVSE